MSGPDLDRMERVVVEGRADITAGLARAEVVSGASLPELVQGAEAMKAAMTVIQPALSAGQRDEQGRGAVVIGTVEGDLHDIGKSLVGTLLAANGFAVHDLGSDVPVAAFVEKARETGARIVAASALLTTTMTVQEKLVAAIDAAALPSRPRVLVGGAPTSPAWAEQIGATHAENAMRAVAAASELAARGSADG